MSCSKVSKLKLFQWNAQGATTKAVQTQIDHLINEEGIDVVFIVETFLSPKHDFILTNYIVYRNDRGLHGGGVLIAVRNNIEHKRLHNYNTQVAQNVSIEIRMERQPLVLTTAYVPKYTTNFTKDIIMLTPNKKNVIVLGDFNARHVAWNCLANNRAGKVLRNMPHSSNFVMHHPYSHTHFPHSGATPSTIDFALTNSTVLFSNIYTLQGVLPTYHDPVICAIEGFNFTKKTVSRPNFQKANWTNYSEVIEDQLNQHSFKAISEAHIDIQVSKLINVIRVAEGKAVPIVTKNIQKTTISKASIDLIKLRNVTKQNKCIEQQVDNDFNDKRGNAVRSLKPETQRFGRWRKKC